MSGKKLRQAQVQSALVTLLIQCEHFSDAEPPALLRPAIGYWKSGNRRYSVSSSQTGYALCQTHRYARLNEHHIRFHEIETHHKDAERLKQMQQLQIRYEVRRLQDERKFFEQQAAKFEVDIQH